MRIADRDIVHEDPARLPRSTSPGSTRLTRAKDAVLTRKAGVAIVVSFLTLSAVFALLSALGLISTEMLSVLLWSLLGLYFAFGILIVAYRLISRLP